MKTFSEKFEQNANLQLRKVTRAIDLYVKNVYIKSRLIRYVSSQAGFGMMQPLALKNFSDVAYSYLEPIIGSDNISMFTVVADKYNFGQDNWNFQYKSFQKKIKKIFKGYDYIANVALDEFPRIITQAPKHLLRQFVISCGLLTGKGLPIKLLTLESIAVNFIRLSPIVDRSYIKAADFGYFQEYAFLTAIIGFDPDFIIKRISF